MPALFRVMHVITGLGSGGAEGQLALLAARQKADGLDPIVVSLVPGGVNERSLAASGVTVASLGMARGRPGLGAPIRLARLIRRYEPDILQSWLFHADLLATFALPLSGRWRRTALIWSLRCSQMAFESYRPTLKWVIKGCALLSRFPAAVAANSTAGRDYYRALGYRPKAFPVIANGIDTEKFCPDISARTRIRKALAIAENAPLLAMVARIDPMKDHKTFFRALDRLPDCGAVVIGEGTEALPDRRNLHRLGRRDDVPQLLAACDVIVSNSAFGEGFSNVVAEGMAAGLPAVATDVGDARVIVGDTGAIVPPRDPERLAQAVNDILARDHHALGATARERIKQLYSVDRMVFAYAELYASCLGQRPHVASGQSR